MEGRHSRREVSRNTEEGDEEQHNDTEPQDVKTTYILTRATPLSGLQRIFSFKPKLLLQLQEVTFRTHHLPVIDVFVSNIGSYSSLKRP